MNRVGIHDGTIFRYHQTRRNTKNYQVDLEVLQYDMLYGKRYVYGEDGETPYERVQLQMGVLPVTLERIEKIRRRYLVFLRRKLYGVEPCGSQRGDTGYRLCQPVDSDGA